MLGLLARRNLLDRPWRTALLCLGYGFGVAVMVVLLSIGEALLAQAGDEKLVGGGDVTVLPEGLDVEVLKTGGLGGLYFSIQNARFVQQQLLAAPRLAGDVGAVAPQIDGKLLYLTLPARNGTPGREVPVRGAGEVPSATAAVGAAPALGGGAWADDAGDRRWTRPAPAELRHDIDHFHLPPPGLAARESWAEWHYFNVLSPDRRRWAFVTLMVVGDVGEPDGAGPDGRPRPRWGGQVLVTTHAQGEGGRAGAVRRFAARVPPTAVRFSTRDADVRVGDASVTVLPDGRYRVVAAAPAEDGLGGRATVDLLVAPAPRAYFPGATLQSGDFASGYAVAGLRADAAGRVCAPGWGRDAGCERYAGTQAYHDHNWGVWRDVTWEWGAGRAGAYTLLYGRVAPPGAPANTAPPGAPENTASRDSAGAAAPLFLYLVDSLGFRALFRPRLIRYDDARTIVVGARAVRIPARGVMEDARGADTLRVELEVEDAAATDTRLGFIERGEAAAARRLARPYFVQMKGRLRVSGRAGGAPVVGEGAGFFETYR